MDRTPESLRIQVKRIDKLTKSLSDFSLGDELHVIVREVTIGLEAVVTLPGDGMCRDCAWTLAPVGDLCLSVSPPSVACILQPQNGTYLELGKTLLKRSHQSNGSLMPTIAEIHHSVY